MAQEAEGRGANVEEAVEAALAELGVSEQEVRIEVLQEPKGGFLGVGGHEAVVRARLKAGRQEVDMDALEEQADTAADFIDELLVRMDIDAVAEPNLVGDHMYVDIVGDDEDDMALLIGRHGQTLDAIQEPISLFEPIYHDGGVPIFVMDQISDERSLDSSWIEGISIREAMARLGEREKLILTKRFFDGRTQMEVAEEIGISQAQVSRLEKAALKNLRRFMSG